VGKRSGASAAKTNFRDTRGQRGARGPNFQILVALSRHRDRKLSEATAQRGIRAEYSIQNAYIRGVSTRLVDDPVKATDRTDVFEGFDYVWPGDLYEGRVQEARRMGTLMATVGVNGIAG
jgi:hypothetical protein